MKIAIANDVPLIVRVLQKLIVEQTDHEVIWTASNGAEAVELCARSQPDILLMDLIMPVMNGTEATRQIMAATPCVILVVTASVKQNRSLVFQALGAGARDAVKTPSLGLDGQGAKDFLNKLNRIAILVDKVSRPPTTPQPMVVVPSSAHQPAASDLPLLIAIGSSSGGPSALKTLLSGLPGDLDAAIVIIQHINDDFSKSLAQWLNSLSKLPVRLAAENDHLRAGQVLIAGGDRHLSLDSLGRLTYLVEPSDNPYRPSVDIFFTSVACKWRGEAIGALLTGMGRDGAKGMGSMLKRGHHTIAQDEATSAIFGMPQAAIKAGAAREILPIEAIGPRLIQLVLDQRKVGRREP